MGPRSRDGPIFRPNPICGADRAVQAGASRLTDSRVWLKARAQACRPAVPPVACSPRARAPRSCTPEHVKTGFLADRCRPVPRATARPQLRWRSCHPDPVAAAVREAARDRRHLSRTAPARLLVRIALGYANRGPGPGERVTFLRHTTSDASSHGRRETDSMARAAPGLGVA